MLKRPLYLAAVCSLILGLLAGYQNCGRSPFYPGPLNKPTGFKFAAGKTFYLIEEGIRCQLNLPVQSGELGKRTYKAKLEFGEETYTHQPTCTDIAFQPERLDLSLFEFSDDNKKVKFQGSVFEYMEEEPVLPVPLEDIMGTSYVYAPEGYTCIRTGSGETVSTYADKISFRPSGVLISGDGCSLTMDEATYEPNQYGFSMDMKEFTFDGRHYVRSSP